MPFSEAFFAASMAPPSWFSPSVMFQKHFGRDVIACDGELGEGVARKDYHAHLVVLHPVHQLGHQPFGLFQAAGLHVLGQHGVRYVQRDDDFYALAFHGLQLGAELGTGQKDGEKPYGRPHEPKLHVGPILRDVRHQLGHQFGVAKPPDGLAPAVVGIQIECGQHREQYQ